MHGSVPVCRNQPRICFATAFRGLGAIAGGEIRDKLGVDAGRAAVHPTRNFDLVRFKYPGPAGNLSMLGCAEDVFALVEDVTLTGKPPDLKILRNRVARSPRLAVALNTVGEFRLAAGKGPGRARNFTFRVPCSAEDAPWRLYRRTDLVRSVTAGLRHAFPESRPVEDGGDIEAWIHQSGRRAFVSLRLSDITMRQREYKAVNLPASLRPTIARAMALVSRMGDSDVVLDPMCGAGTILIERALAGRYGKLIGGDINPDAVAAARANLGRKHKPWELYAWDATRLPLSDASVDRIITNPPWGRQVGSRDENVPLYYGFLGEAVRVLKPGGLAVVLTSEWNLLRETLRRLPELAVVQTVRNVSVLGWHADIVSIARRGELV
jgi:SAM-dependent methyltransferase